jgi:hypothetical protein
MKKLNYLLWMAMAISFFSCKDSKDPKYLTVINPDGSCYKIIESIADSAFIVGDTAKSNPFGITLDSAWKISWSYITPEYKTNWPLQKWEWDTAFKHEPLKVKAQRNYNSIKEMSEKFRFSKDHRWSTIVPRYNLEKKFSWFYTYYNYSELYPKIKTFEKIPFEKHLTKAEAEFWFNGDLDLIKGMNGIEIKEEVKSVEQNFNLWFEHNVWEEEMDVLINNYHLLKNPPVTKESLKAMKDSLFDIYELKKSDKDFKDQGLGYFLDYYYKSKAYTELSNRPGNPLKAYEDSVGKEEFTKYFETSINYNLLMPGKIMTAENAINHGDTLKFNLDAYRMTYKDYEIKATSRKTNTWAFWVTGIIVLVAVGSLFVKRK